MISFAKCFKTDFRSVEVESLMGVARIVPEAFYVKKEIRAES